MPSSCTIDQDPSRLVATLIEEAKPTREELGLIGDLAKTTVLRRTARGVDVDGVPFAPYSAAYAKKRAKAGRQTTVVDLLLSGRMLQALSVVVREAVGEVTLAIYGEEGVRAKAHNEGLGHMPRRRWQALSVAEGTKLATVLERLIGKRIAAKKL